MPCLPSTFSSGPHYDLFWEIAVTLSLTLTTQCRLPCPPIHRPIPHHPLPLAHHLSLTAESYNPNFLHALENFDLPNWGCNFCLDTTSTLTTTFSQSATFQIPDPNPLSRIAHKMALHASSGHCSAPSPKSWVTGRTIPGRKSFLIRPASGSSCRGVLMRPVEYTKLKSLQDPGQSCSLLRGLLVSPIRHSLLSSIFTYIPRNTSNRPSLPMVL